MLVDTDDFLAPEQGVWAGFGLWQPYENRVAELLLWEHGHRLCQMVFLASFERESAVYIVLEEGKAVVVTKELRPQLWYSIMMVLERKPGASQELSAEDERAALDQANINVIRATAILDESTFKLLDRVWQAMLQPLKKGRVHGIDGDTYHAAHLVADSGYMSGRAYSPREGSPVHSFVQVGKALREVATAEVQEKQIAEQRLAALARQLLEVLDERR